MRRRTFFRCTIMRGGTSKGIFLMEEDLPPDPELRERIILAIFGSPDIRQIDGLGGADSLTSKLALVAPSNEPDRDVTYTFGAVGIDKPFVDYSANCGNISSAVGPYAIDRGWVKAEEPYTTVRIFNTNTKKMIHARVPVRRGKVVSEGDYAIDGVPGTGAKIELTFMDPGGALTGRLLPTGNEVDEVVLETGERFLVTIVDAGNPTAFLLAEELGLRGTELPEFLERAPEIKAKLEGLRKKVGELSGIPFTPSIPKIALVASPQDYTTIAGQSVRKEEIDILARLMAMGRLHKAFAITAGIPAAAASALPGSLVHRVMAKAGGISGEGRLTIGHPSGQMDVGVEAREEEGRVRVVSCTIGRTARKIMEGRVYISKKVYS
ncbi:MAG: 3-methylitaconate isomerase [Syntrophaceae bacterium]|nr:3-methylitaconate isomerase [Syntrophaceae bacterium]